MMTIHTDYAPWTAFIDMSPCDQNQQFLFMTEIELQYPDDPGIDGLGDQHPTSPVWVPDQQFYVHREHPTQGNKAMILSVNEQPVSISPLLKIEPEPGPWRSRLTVVQISGMKIALRCLVW